MEKVIFFICCIFLLATEKVYSIDLNLETVQALGHNKQEVHSIKGQASLQKTLEKIEILTKNSSQIRVLGLKWENETFVMDFSDDILEYSGGNTMEFIVGNLILDWAFANTEAEAVTILINGEKAIFPEGTDFTHYTREMYLQNSVLREEIYEENNICNNE